MLAIVERFEKVRRHRISRNATWVFLGQGINFLVQAGYFILLARLLGVREYGVFAGAFAFVNLVTPYSALGAGMLFMRYVTEDRTKAAVYWGNSIAVTVVVSLIIAGGLCVAGPALTKVHSHLIFVILVLANCLFSQIATLGSQVFQTFEKMRWVAILSMASSVARLVVLIVMQATLHHATAFQWSIGVFIASALAAGFAMALVRAEIGPAGFQRDLVVQRVAEGFGFSFAGTTQAAYNDADKVMLSHYGLNRENGFYTLAYRIIDFATTPIIGLDVAVLPRFFRLGQAKMGNVVKLAAKSVAAAVFLGLLIYLGVMLMAPLVPHLVGRDFSGVLIALRWLCWLPLLRGIHRMTGTALTGSGHQKLRTTAQVTVAAANFLLNLWWIPVYGWIGAAWSSVISDGLLAVLNTLMLLWLWKRWSGREVGVLAEEGAY